MDIVKICAKKSDGTVYRVFHATVLEQTSKKLVAYQKAGNEILQNGKRWYAPNNVILYFWFDRPFNLFEAYGIDGTKKDLYVNIASPAELDQDTLIYTDYELDLELKMDGKVVLKDKDEFIQAQKEFKYSPEFVEDCYKWVEECKELLKHWKWRGWEKA